MTKKEIVFNTKEIVMSKQVRETNWYPDTYKEGDEINIVSLMEDDIKSRGSQAIFDKKHWLWKYKNNNAGFYPNWIKLAKGKKDDFIGGHYTVIPAMLKANGKVVLSSQSVDTMTHVTFRRQGVFTELANFCYEELIKDKSDVIFGYPNDNSYPGFVKKLDWKHIYTVHELGYILDVPKLVDYKFKNGMKNLAAKIGLGVFFNGHRFLNKRKKDQSFNYEQIQIDDIDPIIVDSIISSNYTYYLDRSLDYFKWRYSNNPNDKEIFVCRITKADKIVGYYVIKFKTYPHRNNVRIAHVMELILDESSTTIYENVLNNIVEVSKREKATMLYTYSHEKQFDFSAYKKYGFIKLDNKNFIIRINNNEPNYKGISDAKNWFITQGDADRA